LERWGVARAVSLWGERASCGPLQLLTRSSGFGSGRRSCSALRSPLRAPRPTPSCQSAPRRRSVRWRWASAVDGTARVSSPLPRRRTRRRRSPELQDGPRGVTGAFSPRPPGALGMPLQAPFDQTTDLSQMTLWRSCCAGGEHVLEASLQGCQERLHRAPLDKFRAPEGSIGAVGVARGAAPKGSRLHHSLYRRRCRLAGWARQSV
jgi:hypothetical protein